ncbi:DUF4134 family protein [Bergeyella cardium]|jgi:conjugative transposon protein traE|uniref:DUF4134 domain-containing protein n=1 Tax=Bergeyella cardium TaxID=1585976 RepID=A0A6P1QVC3_9FLAO|nr:DUF4134 family protein [Bergeyella cardium]QHN64624.1 DUF4134 domain-containing protein [Bergeyella cardium]WHE33922.1 DUF4134 family protein [Bergeyella cardium]WHF60572.1 DUF4134 family protein [Bergeyella cardium]
MNGTFKKLKGLKLANFKGVKREKVFILSLLLLSTTPVLAGGGAGAFTTAGNEVKKYWTPLKTFIQFVGGIVGLIGGLRIYNKWQNGDQDVNKEILGWGGACLFLTIVPTFVGSFFGLT